MGKGGGWPSNVRAYDLLNALRKSGKCLGCDFAPKKQALLRVYVYTILIFKCPLSAVYLAELLRR